MESYPEKEVATQPSIAQIGNAEGALYLAKKFRYKI